MGLVLMLMRCAKALAGNGHLVNGEWRRYRFAEGVAERRHKDRIKWTITTVQATYTKKGRSLPSDQLHASRILDTVSNHKLFTTI